MMWFKLLTFVFQTNIPWFAVYIRFCYVAITPKLTNLKYQPFCLVYNFVGWLGGSSGQASCSGLCWMPSCICNQPVGLMTADWSKLASLTCLMVWWLLAGWLGFPLCGSSFSSDLLGLIYIMVLRFQPKKDKSQSVLFNLLFGSPLLIFYFLKHVTQTTKIKGVEKWTPSPVWRNCRSVATFSTCSTVFKPCFLKVIPNLFYRIAL